MSEFTRDIQIRWSDLDPNFHLCHSVYYDWGACCRVEFLYSIGLTAEKLKEMNIGPILFREECVFKKEIRYEDKVTINMVLLKAKKDFSRWSVRHEIKKNGEILAALITVDIAWLDTIHRKLANLPHEVQMPFYNIPKAADFNWLD